jgi:hypothetical protein
VPRRDCATIDGADILANAPTGRDGAEGRAVDVQNHLGCSSHRGVADLAAEAIDSLGPKVKAPARPVGKPGRRLRVQELATKAIEKIIDPAAPPEEQAQRRRRLTKGPTEFREARVDQPKVKTK